MYNSIVRLTLSVRNKRTQNIKTLYVKKEHAYLQVVKLGVRKTIETQLFV